MSIDFSTEFGGIFLDHCLKCGISSCGMIIPYPKKCYNYLRFAMPGHARTDIVQLLLVVKSFLSWGVAKFEVRPLGAKSTQCDTLRMVSVGKLGLPRHCVSSDKSSDHCAGVIIRCLLIYKQHSAKVSSWGTNHRCPFPISCLIKGTNIGKQMIHNNDPTEPIKVINRPRPIAIFPQRTSLGHRDPH